MIPCLYQSTETAFDNNGIGKLSDCISCSVSEKRNGAYELTMTYPSDGIHADQLVDGNIILAKCAPVGQTQPFEIYKLDYKLPGTVSVKARHISYRLNYVTTSKISPVSGSAAALSAINSAVSVSHPFTIQMGFTASGDFYTPKPYTLRSLIGGNDDSLIASFGGEIEWDRFTVYIRQERGADRGVKLRYGKNITDFTYARSVDNLVAGIHPYWGAPETGNIVELPERVVYSSSQASGRVAVQDFTSQFDTSPSETELREAAMTHLSTMQTEPQIDMKIKLISLSQSEYADVAEAENVLLCDTVHVYVPKLRCELSCCVTETVYNSLLERYDSITVSNAIDSSRNASLPKYFKKEKKETEQNLKNYADSKLSDTIKSITEIRTKADENESAITLLASWKNEAVESISQITQKANANESSITAINSWRSGATTAISTLQSWVSSYGAELEGLANYTYDGSSGLAGIRAYARRQADDVADDAANSAITAMTEMFAEFTDSDGNVTKASITAAVEDAMSSVEISADQIRLDGDTYFTAKYRQNSNVYNFGSIKTSDTGSGQEDDSRYALIVESNGGNGWYSNYPVALKLKSEGNMSLASSKALYLDSARYTTINAGDNTRIRANVRYSGLTAAPATDQNSINVAYDYVFCTDGIYYNGNRIISSDGKVRLVFS